MAEARRDRDSLENNMNNPEAVELIQQLYGVDVEIATDLWHRFIGTIEKIALISTKQPPKKEDKKDKEDKDS